MKNQAIMQKKTAANVPYWRIADELGISENTMLRRMHHQLPADQEAKVLEAIEKAAAKMKDESIEENEAISKTIEIRERKTPVSNVTIDKSFFSSRPGGRPRWADSYPAIVELMKAYDLRTYEIALIIGMNPNYLSRKLSYGAISQEEENRIVSKVKEHIKKEQVKKWKQHLEKHKPSELTDQMSFEDREVNDEQ